MTLSESQRTYLLAQPSFSGYVVDRLFPERAFQDTARPFVVYHIETVEPEPQMTGPANFLESTVEYTVVSASYDEAFEIAEVIRGLLSYFSGPMSTFTIKSVMFDRMAGGYDSDFDLYTVDVLLTFQYAPQ